MGWHRVPVSYTAISRGSALLASGIESRAGAGAARNGKALSKSAAVDATRSIATRKGRVLGGVYGRAVGSLDSFQYSDALKKAKIVWNDETLGPLAHRHEKVVPGNDMTFHVEKAEERRAIINYLKQNSPADRR